MTAQPDVYDTTLARPAPADVAIIAQPDAAPAPRTRRTERRAKGHPSSLRRALVVVDVVMVAAAWAIGLSLPTTILQEAPVPVVPRFLAVAGLTVAAIALFSVERLYLGRVCGVRSVELNRLGLSAALVGGALFVGQALRGDAGTRVIIATVMMFVFTAFGRSAYDAWLKTMRASGRYARPIVLIGANGESLELAELLRDHPEFGYVPVGVVGDAADRVRWNDGIPWLGDLDDAADAVAQQGASGALVAVSALTPDELNHITRGLLKQRVHVHLSPGLRGISHRRLRALPISHEPIFYLEPVLLPAWKLRVKRAIDLTIAATLLLLSLPLLIVAAIAIKLTDRGPILYRQVRVGRNGNEFTLLKLRTMRPGADRELPQLTALNERDGGPLFKASHDPRRTRVGRILELSSIDEIPQLLNVLRGQMSIVGPRPALPEEVARFDAELWTRHDVPPGITGLWQVEARDNPSFTAYRRLDLFYVENWSVALDLAIVFATVRCVVSRLFRSSS